MMPLSIKRITLQGGNIAYSDRFIKPNYDANLTGMGGRLNGLSSDPTTIAELDLRGKVVNAAPVEVVGRLNPFAGHQGVGQGFRALQRVDLRRKVRGLRHREGQAVGDPQLQG